MSVAESTSTTARLEKVIGAEHLFTDAERLAEYAIDAIAPKTMARPENAVQTAEIVRTAVAEKLGVIPCGHREEAEAARNPARDSAHKRWRRKVPSHPKSKATCHSLSFLALLFSPLALWIPRTLLRYGFT